MFENTHRRFWDWKTRSLIGIVILMMFCSLLLLMDTTSESASLSKLWVKQTVWLFLGAIVAFIVTLIDYKIYLKCAYLFYGIILGLLLLTEIYGAKVSGAQSWIAVPWVGIRIQPSEFAKLAVILVLVQSLASREGKIVSLRDILWPMALVAIPAILIIRQPDPGTAIVLVPITLGMFFLAGMPWVYLIFFLAPLAGFLALAQSGWITFLWLAGLLAMSLLMHRGKIVIIDRLVFWTSYIGAYLSMPTLWSLLKPHQKSRLLVFWDPTYELDRAGYNLMQSKIAIGSGGFFGKGFGQGTQSRLEFLPEYHTDFPFAVLAEDWGFSGSMIFFLWFFTLLFLCLQIARDTRSFRGGLLAGGVAFYFLTHFAINVGMAMGMLPVAGLPLSFLSYGGSHLLVCLIGIGLVLNVKLRRFE